MANPEATNWCRWLLSLLLGGVLIPLAGWAVKTTAANQAEIEVMQDRLDRIERKLDRLLQQEAR